MTDVEKRTIVKKEIGKIHHQLVINSHKTCGAGTSKWADDLLAMCIEMFFEKKTDYIWKVYQDGKLENFITFMMGFQLKSGSSRFYHKYRKASEKSRELFENKQLLQKQVHYNTAFSNEPSEMYLCMKAVIKDLNVYEKMVVNEIMVEKRNFNETSKKYNINYYTLKKDYKRLKSLIKSKCQHLR
jgi:hypothetical protein